MPAPSRKPKPSRAATPSTFAPTRANTKAFRTPAAWSKWLAAHQATSDGVWLRLYKKGSGVASIDHAQALDEALCHGWIDGQKKPLDARSWLQRFTPRRPRSPWSKRNRDHVARLTREGRMRPGGLAEVAAAQADGRWDRAYDSPANAKVPADFLRALRRDPKALGFFKGLNRANVFAICYRLQTAKKPETRQRRLDAFVQMMKEGRKIH